MAHEYDGYDPDLMPTPEFQLLQDLVKNPNASSADAVQQVVGLTKAEALSGKWPENRIRGDFAWNVIHLMLDIATNTKPEKQTMLLDFMRQLQKTEVNDPRTGEPPIYDYEKLWTDLPCVGYYVADCWNFIHYGQHTREQIEKWENWNAFLAKATATFEFNDGSSEPSHTLDFSLFGHYALTRAFDYEDKYETTVRTVCIWYIYATEKVWTNCKNANKFGHDSRGYDVNQWNQWNQWKQELMAARSVYEDAGTQELIREAMECINRVESSEHRGS